MKRFGISLCSLLVVVLFAATSIAGPPLDGIYDSTDLGGPANTGRHSESFLVPNGAQNAGTTLNAESWDGTSLGLQWRYYCATMQTAAVLLVDAVNPTTGNGNRTYMKTFSGGYVWLSGTGPWANGDPDYPGVIDTYVVFETIQYTGWVRVAAVSNVQASGHFDNYPATCMTFNIGNGVEIGSTDFAETKPLTYPDLLQQTTCDPVMTLGSWWDMLTLTFTITGCTSPTEEKSWGAVKALYAD